MAVVFEASTSPLVGREGDIVGARQLKERLMREKESNISMRIEETEDFITGGSSCRPRCSSSVRPHGDHAS